MKKLFLILSITMYSIAKWNTVTVPDDSTDCQTVCSDNSYSETQISSPDSNGQGQYNCYCK